MAGTEPANFLRGLFFELLQNHQNLGVIVSFTTDNVAYRSAASHCSHSLVGHAFLLRAHVKL